MNCLLRFAPTLITIALLSACTAPGDDSSGITVKDEASVVTSAVVCPDTLEAVELDQVPDYDSWLAMKGGGYGHIVREWHNGCEQQLSFPASAADNPHADEAQSDYKPVHSPDGKHIAFFRRHFSTAVEPETLTLIGDNIHGDWRTTINLINAEDGSNLRELTSIDNAPAFNPHWTRKQFPNRSGGLGYRVSFTRGGQVWWTDADAQPGDERLLTDPNLGGFFGYTSLKDGRILVRDEESFELALITPDENDPSQTKIEPISYDHGPVETVLHKITISNDETKISYMKVQPAHSPHSADAFGNALIAFADFDAETRTISNEVVVSDVAYNLVNIEWYTSFSPNSQQMIWACSGNCSYWTPELPVNYYTDNSQIVEYDFRTQEIRRISLHHDALYRYPNIWGSVK